MVIYTRNDTGAVDRQQTTDRGVSIENLFPGAGYRVQVYAVSHGLQSAPHTSFQAVPPAPPLGLVVTGVEDTSVSLAWSPPEDSLYTGNIDQSDAFIATIDQLEFLLRYRAVTGGRGEGAWSEVGVAGDQTSHILTGNIDQSEAFILTFDQSEAIFLTSDQSKAIFLTSNQPEEAFILTFNQSEAIFPTSDQSEAFFSTFHQSEAILLTSYQSEVLILTSFQT